MNHKLVITLTLCYVIYICKSNAIDPCSSQPDNSDLNVIPMYGKCSPFNPPKPDSWDNRIINMASKDPARMSYLSTLVAQKTASSSPIASGQAFNIGNYVVRVKIGTPGQLLFMVLDTSTDEAFVPSSGCTGCSASATIFSPNSSTSYVPLDCSVPQCGQVRGLSCPATSSGACLFNQSYAGSSFSAILVQDSLRLAKDVIANYSFGSINAISGASIPAQGLLGLGRGPLSLLSQSGSIYSVRDEFRKQVTGPFSSLGAFDTCFVKTYETLAPAVTLHFTDLDLKLPMENSLIHSSSGSLACLAMAAAPSNVNSVLNVIANFQQQNLRVLFDTVNSKVGIAREVCN
ncbi:unnamed protein product [Vicia faba]|uniref:Peptidase A1 domain-containing protein n=1 Tax=Vicia faba TaxID=3906 RepID=A0AAV0ZMU6_VICFA|nr:unnamed protein product [Vicia faba]